MSERRLRRLMALLLALAVLAERAAGRSWPVRHLVLWMLRRAEFATGDFVFAATGTPPSAFAGIAADENSAAEAYRLVASFRMLAAILGGLLRLALRRAFPAGPVVPSPGRPLDLRTRKPNDTS